MRSRIEEALYYSVKLGLMGVTFASFAHTVETPNLLSNLPSCNDFQNPFLNPVPFHGTAVCEYDYSNAFSSVFNNPIFSLWEMTSLIGVGIVGMSVAICNWAASQEEYAVQESRVAFELPAIQPMPLENDYERRLREAGYEGPIPRKYIDPVSFSIMINPVILVTENATGLSFDITTMVDLVRNQLPCPHTHKPITGYVPNRHLKNEIEEWVQSIEQEMAKKPLRELPREVSKEKLLSAQSMFYHRASKSPALNAEELRSRVGLSRTVD